MTFKDIIYHIAFYGTALMVIGSALVVAFGKNIVRSAFALFLAFFGIAGLYVFMAADFMAALQILIYVGGILVLILFAVMLTHKIQDVKLSNPVTKPFVAAPLCLIILTGLVWIIIESPWQVKALTIAPTTAEIGKALMGYYLLPFEAVSVVLLIALLGAAYLARPVRSNPESIRDADTPSAGRTSNGARPVIPNGIPSGKGDKTSADPAAGSRSQKENK